jgi:hypothetical protein
MLDAYIELVSSRSNILEVEDGAKSKFELGSG